MEPIGEWTTTDLQRFITQRIPSASFPMPKGLKLDSIAVGKLVVKGSLQTAVEGLYVVRNAQMSNAWQNFGGTFNDFNYWKDPFGVVHLSGVLKNAGGPGQGNLTICFTLPVGYRPPTDIQLPQRATIAGADYGALANITKAGTIQMGVGSVAANVAVANITIEGTFRV